MDRLINNSNSLSSKILADLHTGWWKFNKKKRYFIFSDYAKQLFSFDSNRVSPEVVVQCIREDYRESMWKLQDRENTFELERIYPVIINGQEFWIRTKSLGMDEENKDFEVGYLQRTDSHEREESYQSLYEHIPMAYIRNQVVFDEDGAPFDYIPINANRAAFNFFETSLQSFMDVRGSKSMQHRFNSYMKSFTRVLQEGYLEFQSWMDGANKYCQIIMYPVGKDQVVCLFSDLTEVHQMHKKLDHREKILSNIYDNMPIGIELYDKEGVLINANNSNYEIFGLDPKEEVVRHLNLFDDPNYPSEVFEKLKRKEKVAFRCNYSFDLAKETNYLPSCKDGFIDLFINGNALYDNTGEITSYMFMVMDNTEINQAHSRITDFEKSFSLISIYGKIGFCKFDLISKEGEGIDQWFRNLGEKPQTPLKEIIGVYSHVHEDDFQKLKEHIRNVMAGNINSFTEELRIKRENGVWTWTQVNVLRNPANTNPEKLEMLCINNDITHLKETEEMLREAKEKAESSDKLKSAFVANMSHEIRTPLNSIVGFSDLLAQTDIPEEKKMYTDIIQENNDVLLQLISDILDLSKIEAGVLDFSYDRVCVNDLCEEIVQTYSFKNANSPVEIRCGKGFPDCYVYSDKNRLTQVISNLVNNALKFTDEGSITIGFEQEGADKIRFYVQDTGCGIPEEAQKNIFGRFVKQNSFVQGTGLGLSICESIVNQLNGEIGVTSKEGEGACFWFTHPYTPTLSNDSKSQENVAVISEKTEKSPEEKKTILVAEDNESNFLLIKSILRNKYTLLRARTGLEALEVLEKQLPDLILMDIDMPEMDGLTATQEIRKKNIQTPIVAVTAYAFDDDKKKALNAGCTDYMSKPIKSAKLHELIEKLL